MTSADELTLTEVIFDNVLDGLEPEEIAAVCSAFIFSEKHELSEAYELPEKVEAAKKTILAKHLELEKLQNSLRVELDSEEWVRSVNFGIAHAVYQWATGTAFSDIMQMVEVQEGAIVRSIVRLEELLRKIRVTCRLIKNEELEKKMDLASEAIKRDIVFASSLYIV